MTLAKSMKTPENTFVFKNLSAFCDEVNLKEQTFRNWLSRNELNFKNDSFYYKGYWFYPVRFLKSDKMKGNPINLR